MKQCSSCKCAKNLEAFPRDSGSSDGRRSSCTDCRNVWRAANREHILATEADWRAANPDKVRQYKDRHRAGQHGLTVEQYSEMVRAHGGLCAICQRPFPGTPQIDHDHSCCSGSTGCRKCVRGLLCPQCNTRLAPVEDAAWISAASEYLRQHRKP